MSEETAVAIITARGGSRRVPLKNIRAFCGEPIIAYSIRAALAAGCFDEVMVSTDHQGIADIGRTYGAAVPFLRSAAASSDNATTAEALVDVLTAYEAAGRHFDLACCLYPTAPFVTPEVLREGRRLLEADPTLVGVTPVTRYPHPIQRALRIAAGGRLLPFQPEHVAARSQDLEPAYHDAAQFYWIRVPEFLVSPGLMTQRTGALELPESEVQDIDTEDDWSQAEIKYRLLRERR